MTIETVDDGGKVRRRHTDTMMQYERVGCEQSRTRWGLSMPARSSGRAPHFPVTPGVRARLLAFDFASLTRQSRLGRKRAPTTGSIEQLLTCRGLFQSLEQERRPRGAAGGALGAGGSETTGQKLVSQFLKGGSIHQLVKWLVVHIAERRIKPGARPEIAIGSEIGLIPWVEAVAGLAGMRLRVHRLRLAVIYVVGERSGIGVR
jgi:hypothetical protein